MFVFHLTHSISRRGWCRTGRFRPERLGLQPCSAKYPSWEGP